MATSHVRPRRGLAPAIGFRLLGAFLAASLLFAAGCGGKTPEEKLASAVEKLNAQPPDLFGAMNILRGLTKDAKAPRDIQFQAYAQLSDLYLRHMRQPDEALEMLREAMKVQPSDTEQGQDAFIAYVRMQAGLGKPAEALKEAVAFLEGPDAAGLPVPKRTQLRLIVASLRAGSGEKEAARADLEKMLEEFNDDESVNALHQQILDMIVSTYLPMSPEDPGDIPGAAERYLAYAEKRPKSDLAKKARFGAGVFYAQLGEKEKADPLLEEFFAEAKGRVEKAIDPAEKANELLALSRAYQLVGRVDEQADLWLDALENTYGKEPERYIAVLASQAIPSLVLAKRQEKARELILGIATKFPNSKEAGQSAMLLANFETLLKNIEQVEAAEAKAKADAEAAANGDAAADGDAAPASEGTAPVAEATPEAGAGE